MAYDVTGDATYPVNVTLPEGGDTHTTAAEVVAALGQALADRAEWLKYRKAQLDSANTFEDTITVAVDDASHAALQVDRVADDDPHVGNKLKLIGAFKVGNGGGYTRLYVGTKLYAPLVITTNAAWSTSAQNWSADVTTVDSFLLSIAPTGLSFAKRAAGAGTWTSFPNAGDAYIGGSVSVPGSGGVNSQAGFISAGGGCTVNGEYAYSPVRARTQILNAAFAQSVLNYDSGGSVPSDASLHAVSIPLVVPPGGVCGNIQLLVNQATAANCSAQLVERVLNWTSPGAPTMTPIYSDGGNATAGYKLLTIPCSGFTPNAAREYRVQWIPGHISDTLCGVRMVNFQDAGPINTL